MNKTIVSALAFIALGGLITSCGKDSVDLSVVRGDEARGLLGDVASGDLKSDSLALVDLYQSLDGDHWTTSDGWCSAKPLAEWANVTVATVGAQPRVVALNLGANGLRGQLPKSLGKLTALESLSLQYNRELTGEIPEELYDLKALRSLRLGMTSLTGGLSDRLGQLKKLDTLDLRTSPYDLSQWWQGDMATAKDHRPNKSTLSGTVPRSIGELRELKYLDLSHQKFTGELPSEIGQLQKLDSLIAFGCSFSGELPEALGNLVHLQYLSLGDNQFTGKLPESLGRLTALRELWISRNALSGEIPASLGALKSLKQLGLEGNKLSGEIPSSLAKLENLYTLYLNDNELSGEIPVDLGGGQQPNLIWVDLRNNNLVGALPLRVKRTLRDEAKYKGIEGLPNFGYTMFAVSGNRLTGAIAPEYLAYPRTLKLIKPQQKGYGFSTQK